MPLFAATIFCGAFLLFLVQPLMGKYLLPWFGGGPGVWTTCLLFFQLLLLGGYAYAHLLQRLAPRRQTLVHVALLVAALAFLPITPAVSWKPSGSDDPVLRILLLLTATLGLPYLVLSATGPLLQRWFSLAHPGASPYRLYALSNAGSLLALLAYPFFFEPRFSRGALALGWSGGLVLFAALCAACAWQVRKVASPVAGGVDPGLSEPGSTPPATSDASPSRLARFLWVALPAVASLLLVATTNKLCLDIAAVPFLWVLPLGVYLVTFIVCFDHPRWYHRNLFAGLLVLCCGLLAYFLSIHGPPLHQQVIALVGTLFVGCMVCHGELYRLRPASSQLTGYYLAIAAGGAAGSLFVTLGAPLVFADFRELQLGLVLLVYLFGMICVWQRSRALVLSLAGGVLTLLFVIPLLQADKSDAWYGWPLSFARHLRDFASAQWLALVAILVVFAFALREGRRLAPAWQPRMMAIPLLLSPLLAAIFINQAASDGTDLFAASRNFYGAYKVFLYDEAPDPTMHSLLLSNGGIVHGLQFRGGPQARWQTTYYKETSGLGRAFAALPGGARRVGAVGLGTGTVAAYGRRGDSFRFYEINPAIVGVATHTFTYLKDTPATVNVALGDARLVMERELRTGQSQQFDLLVLDAFAGDAIPVHLLTREAMAVYLGELRRGGIIAVHISNRHLDLRPVVEGLARDAGLHYLTVSDNLEQDRWWFYSTVWVLLTADKDLLDSDAIRIDAQDSTDHPGKTILWTDDHASLLEVLK